MSWLALTDQDPAQVGAFDVWRRLGKGAQGVVYEAYSSTGSPVAVKVLHPHGVSARPPQREVEAAAKVASRWVAPVRAFDLEGTPAFIATALIRGSNLAEVIGTDGPLSEASLLSVAWAVAAALADIHAAGVVHRDLKPENVIIGPDGPRVVDFGLARLTDDHRTQSTGQPGTLTYLAPELHTPGTSKAESSADVFAWGALVVFAATGRHPFERDTTAAVIDALRSDQPDLQALPLRLRPWAEAALSKSPMDRPWAATISRDLAAGLDDSTLPRSDQGMWLTPEQTAESLYASLPRDQQAALPSLLLRMTSATQVTPDGRGVDLVFRPDPLGQNDLVGASPLGAAATDQLLSRMKDAGLVTGGPPWTINSAVLANWDGLKSWLHGEALGLITYNSIKEGARTWDGGRQPRALLNQRELQAADQWETTRRHAQLNQAEREFLTASHRARSKAARRAKAVMTLLTVLVTAAVSGVLWAIVKQNESESTSAAASAAATSRDLAARSIATTTDPVLSALLAAAAWRIHPTTQARASLATVLARPNRGVLPGKRQTARRISPVFSPDGTTLAVAGNDNNLISFWDLRTHQEIGAPLSGTGLTTAMAFGPDGTVMATGSLDGQIRLWDVKTGQPVGTPLVQPTPVDTLTFQRDGQTLLTYGRGQLRLWNVKTGRLVVQPIRESTADWSAAVFGAGGRVMVASDPKRLRLRDLDRPARPVAATIPLPDQGARTLAVNGDATLLATASGGGGEEFVSSTVRLWDLRTHLQLGTIAQGNQGVSAMAFSPDGRTLALEQLDAAQLWDVQTRQKIGEPFRIPRRLYSLAFSPDGRTLASGIEDGTTWLWDVRSRRQLSAPFDDQGWVEAVAVSSDSRVAATIGDTDSAVTLWDLTTHRQLGHVRSKSPGSVAKALAFSPDGRMLAADLGDGPQVWDAHTLQLLRTFGSGDDSLGTQMAFSPDSTRLAVAGQGVQVWEVATGRRIWRVVRQTTGIDSMAFSPDGTTIAASSGGNGEEGPPSFDKTVRLLDSRTGKQAGVLSGHTSFIQAESFSPDSRTIATAGVDGTVRLWDVTSGRQIGSPLDQGGPVFSVAIAPDGRSLAAASGKQVRFWDLSSRQEIGPPLTGHSNVIFAIAFSPDGQVMVSGSLDKTARVWGTQSPEDPVDAVCVIAGRSLTRQEWERFAPRSPFRRVCP